MCGIVGVAGKISHTVKNTIFKDLMDVCQVRGRDSAGVIKVRNDASQSYTWVKAVGPPSSLFDFRKYESEIERGDAIALVGHTRSRTVGDISLKNAHPFDYVDEKIIGVHNGTLRNHHSLDGHSYNKVDSDVLYGHLAVNGPEETFNVLKGAYACVWWDGNKNTLNFIRNEERPLWFTWSKDMDMMFWASEIWMFAVVERKIDLWNGTNDKGKDKYLQIKPHTLWSFSINAKAGKDERVLTMKPQKTIEPKKEPEVQRYTGNYGCHGGSSWARDPADNVWKPKSEIKGGEVTNPFTAGVGQEDPLDDEIPWTIGKPPLVVQPPLVLPDTPGKAGGSGNTNIGNVSFMNSSVKPSDLVKDSMNSRKFPREILSLPSKNSKRSPQTNKNAPSDESKESQENIVSLSEQRKASRPPTSVREVKKVGWFIRDNFKEVEYSVEEFEENTNAICCHCKTPVGDLNEVFEFIDKNNFVCKTCVTPYTAVSYN